MLGKRQPILVIHHHWFPCVQSAQAGQLLPLLSWLLELPAFHSFDNKDYLPAFLWVLITLVVEVQRYLRIQTNAKIVVHDTLLCVVLSAKVSLKAHNSSADKFLHRLTCCHFFHVLLVFHFSVLFSCV